jgi:hypothetical protein
MASKPAMDFLAELNDRKLPTFCVFPDPGTVAFDALLQILVTW